MAFLDETGLAELWEQTKNLVNAHVWVTTATKQIAVNPAVISGEISLDSEVEYSDSVSMVDGSVSLDSPVSVSLSSEDDALTLVGKYCSVKTEGGYANNSIPLNTVFYVPTDTTPTFDFDTAIFSLSYQNVEIVSLDDVSYVCSPDRNAYSEDDGYSYLGVWGGGARIATGSYIGTGKYGASNPNSLTFDFVPKYVRFLGFVYTSGNASNACNVTFFNDSRHTGSLSHFLGNSTATNDIQKVTWSDDGKTVSWYASSLNAQMSSSNINYLYLAIG